MIDLQRPRLIEFRNVLARAIPCEPEGVRQDLSEMALPSLLMRYMNWRDRFIPTRPRNVTTWEGFLRSEQTREHWPSVQRLQRRIAAGQNLSPFLSRKIARYGYVRPVRKKDGKPRGVEWRDKDYVLNAYGVHHLHLGNAMRADGWAKPTRALLYAWFNRESAFLIMVGDHNSFDDGTLSEAVAVARAATGDEIRGILAEETSPVQNNRLQRSGMTTVIKVGEKVVPGAMLSAAGTSPCHTRHADKIMLTIDASEPRLDKPEFTERWFEQAGSSRPSAPQFAWMLNDCDLCLVDRTSRIGFTLVEWCR